MLKPKINSATYSPCRSGPKKSRPVSETGLAVEKRDGKRVVEEFHYLEDRLREQRSKKSDCSFTVPLDNPDSLDKTTIHAHRDPDGTLSFYTFGTCTDPPGEGDWEYDHYLNMDYGRQGGVIHKETEYEIFIRDIFDADDSACVKDLKNKIAVNEATGKIVHES